MLLEVGEFYHNKKTNKICWISRIDRRLREVEMGMMFCKISPNGKEMLFNKSFEVIPIESFYNDYEDDTTRVPYELERR